MLKNKITKFFSIILVAFLGLFNLNIASPIKDNIDQFISLKADTVVNKSPKPFYDDLKQTAENRTIKVFLTNDNYESILSSLIIAQYFISDERADDQYSPVVFLYQQQTVNDQEFSVNIASRLDNWFSQNYPDQVNNKSIINSYNSHPFDKETNISYTTSNVLRFLDFLRVYYHDKYLKNTSEKWSKHLLFDVFLSPELLTTIWETQSQNNELFNFLAYVHKFHVISNTNYLRSTFFDSYQESILDDLKTKSNQRLMADYELTYDSIFPESFKPLDEQKNENGGFLDDPRSKEDLETFNRSSLYELVYREEKFSFYDGLAYSWNDNQQIDENLQLKVHYYEKNYDRFFKRIINDPEKIKKLIKEFLNIFLLTDQYNPEDFFYKNKSIFSDNKDTFLFIEPIATTKLTKGDISLTNTINKWKYDEYQALIKTFYKKFSANNDKYNFIYVTNPGFDGFKERFDEFQNLLDLNNLSIIYTKPVSAYFLYYELFNRYKRGIDNNKKIYVGGINLNDENVLDIYNYLSTETDTNKDTINETIRDVNNYPVPSTFLIDDFELLNRNNPHDYYNVRNINYVNAGIELINQTIDNGFNNQNLINSSSFFSNNNYTDYDPIQRFNMINKILNDEQEQDNEVPIFTVSIVVILLMIIIFMLIFIIYNYKKFRQAKKRWKQIVDNSKK
ncbi:hypothetical protein [Mycoplasma sp. E35C]|uniref:hypothetical protein n=1 Tax=Mycoplasma sp. E35C TaxID=2801918 RepID=UPI001CA3FEA5|nr:hypothetical protein [Mycoplasma sp. E35C]QZX49247.1 hypothetical protein JJE79_00535 [Mycoplasma sp. E35C]